MRKGLKVIEGQFSLFLDEYLSEELSLDLYDSKEISESIETVDKIEGEVIEIKEIELKESVEEVEDRYIDTLDESPISSGNFTIGVFSSQKYVPYINDDSLRELSLCFKGVIEKYKESSSRIFLRKSGSLMVELDNKTLYFNSEGKYEMDLPVNLALAPGDIILIVNEDKPVNQKQINILNGFEIYSCIKRVGDSNIILITSHTVVINPNGWILDYTQAPQYEDFMVYTGNLCDEKKTIIDEDDSVTKQEQKEEETVDADLKAENQNKVKIKEIFEIGEKVFAVYDDYSIEGEVYSIYNNNETINIKWDKGISAFYYKLVTKKV